MSQKIGCGNDLELSRIKSTTTLQIRCGSQAHWYTIFYKMPWLRLYHGTCKWRRSPCLSHCHCTVVLMTPLMNELEISKTCFDLYSEQLSILVSSLHLQISDFILNWRLRPWKFSMTDLKNTKNRHSSKSALAEPRTKNWLGIKHWGFLEAPRSSKGFVWFFFADAF